MTSPIKREVTIGNCTLYQGDCLEILPLLGKVDAVVTDPPYGIGMDGGKIGKAVYEQKDWDSKPIDAQWIVDLGVPAIVWGGNYFDVPPSARWLVWDKQNDVTTFADCELAWTNIAGAVRVFRWLWSGPYQKKREQRFHPTQKPIELMKWCIGFIPNTGTVLDPYMGSGTTIAACAGLGRAAIGIEIDEGYFDIAVRRIQDAVDRPDLFLTPREPEPKQAALFGDAA
jgi:DNA modification methylase